MSVTKLNKDAFDEFVKTGTVLLDFWAEWCGPCRALTPILEELDKDLGDQVKIAKINVDEESELAQRFEIMSIPAIFILKDGKVVNKFVGVQPKHVIEDALK